MTIEIVSLYSMNSGEEMGVTAVMTSDNGENTEKRTFVLSFRQYLEIGISKGECSEELFESISAAADTWQAVRKGISLLGYGACSERAMRSKLISKGFSKEHAENATKELLAMGLLRPDEDAFRAAQKFADKLWGERRIAAALYEKGYSSSSVEFALRSLEDMEIDYVACCTRLIKKRYARYPEDIAERRRMFAALQRYGYSSDQIKEAMRLAFGSDA